MLIGVTVNRSSRQCYELHRNDRPHRWWFIGSKLGSFGTGGMKAIGVVIYGCVLNE
jgi:hypothetical protein